MSWILEPNSNSFGHTPKNKARHDPGLVASSSRPGRRQVWCQWDRRRFIVTSCSGTIVVGSTPVDARRGGDVRAKRVESLLGGSARILDSGLFNTVRTSSIIEAGGPPMLFRLEPTPFHRGPKPLPATHRFIDVLAALPLAIEAD